MLMRVLYANCKYKREAKSMMPKVLIHFFVSIHSGKLNVRQTIIYEIAHTLHILFRVLCI